MNNEIDGAAIGTIFGAIITDLPNLPTEFDGPTRVMVTSIARLYYTHPSEARELERQLYILMWAIEKYRYTERHKVQGFHQEQPSE